MRTLIVITRQGQPGAESKIPIEDWKLYVKNSSTLRMRETPYVVLNPISRTLTRIDPGLADAEILLNGIWYPFLSWREGELFAGLEANSDSPIDALLRRIVDVSNQFQAHMAIDIDDKHKRSGHSLLH